MSAKSLSATILTNGIADEIANGDSLRLLDVARRFNLNQSTVFRWLMRGLPDGNGGRIKLEALRFGKSWQTSEAALRRFLAAMPQSEPTPAVPIRTPSKRERDCDRAKKTLQENYGI